MRADWTAKHRRKGCSGRCRGCRSDRARGHVAVGRSWSEAPALSSFKAVYAAEVVGLVEGPCRGAGESGARCLAIRARLTEGPNEGTAVTIEQPTSNPCTGTLSVGAGVVLGHQPQVEGFEYVFLDPDRRGPLLLLTGIFVAAVVVLGRWRGVASLVGLLATLLVLFWFVVPSILDGNDPLLVSLVGAVAIAFFALYLSHGLSDRTTVALAGARSAAWPRSWRSGSWTDDVDRSRFEEALVVSAVGTNIDLGGLILGGMIIGALGAIDDMTVTQASAVYELHAADPKASARDLLRSGLDRQRSCGIDGQHPRAGVRGASMPILILFVMSHQSAGMIANGEIVATEIVRTLVGSIGLVASVPITTWLASRVATATRQPAGRHVAAEDAVPPIDNGGPEEHPIPEHRRDVRPARFRSAR